MNDESKAKLKRFGVIALAVVVSSAAGFSAGRFSAPLKVETKEVERVVYQDRVVEKVITKKVKAEDRVVYIDRTITDAGVRELITETTKTLEGERTKDESTRDLMHESDKQREVKTVLRPDWRASVLVGASMREPALVITGPLVIGVQVERRIVGGVSLGVWANTVGAAGASGSIEF